MHKRHTEDKSKTLDCNIIGLYQNEISLEQNGGGDFFDITYFLLGIEIFKQFFYFLGYLELSQKSPQQRLLGVFHFQPHLLSLSDGCHPHFIFPMLE